ncbi:MAG: hypothetical protein R6V56_07135, partial [Lentisphaeria bacterium]
LNGGGILLKSYGPGKLAVQDPGMRSPVVYAVTTRLARTLHPPALEQLRRINLTAILLLRAKIGLGSIQPAILLLKIML